MCQYLLYVSASLCIHANIFFAQLYVLTIFNRDESNIFAQYFRIGGEHGKTKRVLQFKMFVYNIFLNQNLLDL